MSKRKSVENDSQVLQNRIKMLKGCEIKENIKICQFESQISKYIKIRESHLNHLSQNQKNKM